VVNSESHAFFHMSTVVLLSVLKKVTIVHWYGLGKILYCTYSKQIRVIIRHAKSHNSAMSTEKFITILQLILRLCKSLVELGQSKLELLQIMWMNWYTIYIYIHFIYLCMFIHITLLLYCYVYLSIKQLFPLYMCIYSLACCPEIFHF
jgi:hypothetical protein